MCRKRIQILMKVQNYKIQKISSSEESYEYMLCINIYKTKKKCTKTGVTQ